MQGYVNHWQEHFGHTFRRSKSFLRFDFLRFPIHSWCEFSSVLSQYFSGSLVNFGGTFAKNWNQESVTFLLTFKTDRKRFLAIQILCFHFFQHSFGRKKNTFQTRKTCPSLVSDQAFNNCRTLSQLFHWNNKSFSIIIFFLWNHHLANQEYEPVPCFQTQHLIIA